MIPEAITRDLQNGMGLDECLKKHNTNLKILFKTNPSDVIHHDMGMQYIEKRGKNFYIKKKQHRSTYFFGIYSSLEDAKKVRDELIGSGWKQNQVDNICKKVGVKRVPGKNEQRYK